MRDKKKQHTALPEDIAASFTRDALRGLDWDPHALDLQLLGTQLPYHAPALTCFWPGVGEVLVPVISLPSAARHCAASCTVQHTAERMRRPQLAREPTPAPTARARARGCLGLAQVGAAAARFTGSEHSHVCPAAAASAAQRGAQRRAVGAVAVRGGSWACTCGLALTAFSSAYRGRAYLGSVLALA